METPAGSVGLPRFRLRTLGGLRLTTAELEATALDDRRKWLAILAFLAADTNGGVSRDRVLATFWPESDTDRARNALNQAVFGIRRALGDDALLGSANELRINPLVVDIDLHRVRRAIDADRLADAIAEYEGPFLDGVFLRDVPEFERWVESSRRACAVRYCTAIETLATSALATGDHATAIRYARLLANADTVNARAAVLLMRALDADGQRAAAVKHGELHKALVRAELGVEANDEVLSELQRLRESSTSDVRSGTSSASGLDATTEDAEDRLSRFAPPMTVASAAPPARRWGRPVHGWIAGLVVAVVGLLGLVAVRRPRGVGYEARRAVVAGFANRTGDSTLNGLGPIAADFIADGLQRSELVDVTDPVTSLLNAAAIPDSAKSRATGEISWLASAAHAGIVVTGDYHREKDSVVIVARVTDAIRDRLIAVTDPVRVSPAEPAGALERLRQRVLGIVAVHLDERVADVLPAPLTRPPTLAAYQEFVDGLLPFQRRVFPQALEHFQRAYAIDSTFVAPLIWQAFAFSNMRRPADRHAAVVALGAHRGQLGALDRNALAYFEAWDNRQPAAQIAALQQASRLAPGSIWTYNLGVALNKVGRNEEAATVFGQIDRTHGWIRYWPDFWVAYAQALRFVSPQRELSIALEGKAVLPPEVRLRILTAEARARAALGQHEELERVIAEMSRAPDPSLVAGDLDYLASEVESRGDTLYARQLLARSLAWLRGLPPNVLETRPHRLMLVNILYASNRCAEAMPIIDRSLAEDANDSEMLANRGVCLARQGQRDGAVKTIDILLAVKDSIDHIFGLRDAARISAVLGERDQAVSYLKEISKLTGRLELRFANDRDFERVANYPPYLAVTRPM